jgi:nucleoside-diphosphate-sugar epimerase
VVGEQLAWDSANFIGAHLTKALLKSDQKVVGLDNFANDKLDMRVHMNTVDSYLINQSQAVLLH